MPILMAENNLLKLKALPLRRHSFYQIPTDSIGLCVVSQCSKYCEEMRRVSLKNQVSLQRLLQVSSAIRC